MFLSKLESKTNFIVHLKLNLNSKPETKINSLNTLKIKYQ